MALPRDALEALSDEVLLARAASGRQEAVAVLFDRHQRSMYGLALRITGDDASAQDAVQDAFVSIWRNASRFDAGRATARSWMLSIAHHRAIDTVRRRRPQSALPDDAQAGVPAALVLPDIWGEVIARLDAATIRRALDRLSDVQREVLELAYFVGLTQQDIAARTGTPLGTVKSRVRLGLMALRTELEAFERVGPAEGAHERPAPPADPIALTCAEVEDLAALYVLDALPDAEAVAVAAHLATCAEPHPSFAELAPLGSALAGSADPVDAPPGLRDRVLASIAATPQVPDPLPGAPRTQDARASTPAPMDARAPVAPDAPRQGWSERLFGRSGSRGWVAAAAMALVLVLVGVGLVSTIQRGDEEAQRLALLSDAVQAVAAGDADVATLTGTGAAAGAGGYAVFPADRPGYIVVSGLPQLPSDEAFQAWYIADGVPVSAGLLTLSDDGLGTLTGLEPVEGTSVVALTVEPRPGVDAPTSDPVVVGELPVPV